MHNIEEYKKGNWGFKTFEQYVDEYMLESFNDGKRYYLNFLHIVKMCWEKLYYKKMKAQIDQYLTIDKATNTARIPPHCSKWVSVAIVDDCNNKIPLGYNEAYVTAPKPKEKKGCGCKKCSCDSELCGTMAGINITYEDLYLVGETDPVQKVIKTKVCDNGDIIEEIKEPYLKKNEEDEDVIVFREYTNRIGAVSKNACGCIIDSPENKKTCSDVAGCRIPCDFTHKKHLNSQGRIKVDSGLGIIYFINVSAKKAVLTFVGVPNFNCKVVLIPEYAGDVLKAYLHYHCMRYRSNISNADKKAAELNMGREEEEFFSFLWPIVPSEMAEIEDRFFKW